MGRDLATVIRVNDFVFVGCHETAHLFHWAVQRLVRDRFSEETSRPTAVDGVGNEHVARRPCTMLNTWVQLRAYGEVKLMRALLPDFATNWKAIRLER